MTGSPHIQHLACFWQAFTRAMVAMARQISMAHKRGSHGDIRKADLLEAALYAGLVRLSKEIAEHAHADQTRARETADALNYLKMLHALMSVLALLIAQLKREIAEAAEQLTSLRGLPAYEDAAMWPAPAQALSFFDSAKSV